MRGYFSQLARQTGLGFDSGGASATAHNERGAPPAPLHSEGVTLVHAQSGESGPETAAKISADVTREHVKVSPPVEKGPVRTLDRERAAQASKEEQREAFESSRWTISESPLALEEVRTGPTTPDESIDQPVKYAPENVDRTDSESVAQFRPESERHVSAASARDTFAKDETIEKQFDGQERLSDAPVLFDMGREELKQSAGSDDRAGQAAAHQSYLREVIKWVTAIPEASVEEFENETPLEDPERSGSASAARKHPLTEASDARLPKALQAQGEPEIQDLNLSIGNISIIIEEPQREILAQAPPPARASGRPERPSETSRLSRHYLRGGSF